MENINIKNLATELMKENKPVFVLVDDGRRGVRYTCKIVEVKEDELILIDKFNITICVKLSAIKLISEARGIWRWQGYGMILFFLANNY